MNASSVDWWRLLLPRRSWTFSSAASSAHRDIAARTNSLVLARVFCSVMAANVSRRVPRAFFHRRVSPCMYAESLLSKPAVLGAVQTRSAGKIFWCADRSLPRSALVLNFRRFPILLHTSAAVAARGSGSAGWRPWGRRYHHRTKTRHGKTTSTRRAINTILRMHGCRDRGARRAAQLVGMALAVPTLAPPRPPPLSARGRGRCRSAPQPDTRWNAGESSRSLAQSHSCD